jgi:hypothetical protein
VAPAEGVWDDAQDAWIAARVRSELVLDHDIRSGNYTIDTENRSLYLIGSARSLYELDRASTVRCASPAMFRVSTGSSRMSRSGREHPSPQGPFGQLPAQALRAARR